MCSAPLTLRSYDSRDDQAVWTLHEWAMRETGVDPSDVPGTDDLREIEASYPGVGGGFVIGVVGGVDPVEPQPEGVIDADTEQLKSLATHDGVLAIMGGYVPRQADRSDERDRLGVAELHRMRVAPPYQRRGYGEALLTEIELQAASDGFTRLLATTSTRQTAALGFYSAHGYEQRATSTAGDYKLVQFEKQL